jgi:hypothetical protein
MVLRAIGFHSRMLRHHFACDKDWQTGRFRLPCPLLADRTPSQSSIVSLQCEEAEARRTARDRRASDPWLADRPLPSYPEQTTTYRDRPTERGPAAVPPTEA